MTERDKWQINLTIMIYKINLFKSTFEWKRKTSDLILNFLQILKVRKELNSENIKQYKRSVVSKYAQMFVIHAVPFYKERLKELTSLCS